MILGNDYLWNIIDAVVLIVAIFYNFGYWYTHVNGKKYIRLWIAVILFIALLVRLALAVNLIDESSFIDIYRPWAAIIYLGFIFGPYIDWNTKAKIVPGKHAD
jgi:hypothetical protein